MKRYLGKHSFSMDEKHIKNRRQIAAWFSLIVWVITLCIISVLLLSLLGKIIEIDITNRYAFGIGVEDLEKSFSSNLKAIVWYTPLYAVSLLLYDFWYGNFDKLFSSLIVKDTPKNEDH